MLAITERDVTIVPGSPRSGNSRSAGVIDIALARHGRTWSLSSPYFRRRRGWPAARRSTMATPGPAAGGRVASPNSIRRNVMAPMMSNASVLLERAIAAGVVCGAVSIARVSRVADFSLQQPGGSAGTRGTVTNGHRDMSTQAIGTVVFRSWLAASRGPGRGHGDEILATDVEPLRYADECEVSG